MGDHRPFDLQASYRMADTVAIRFEQAGWSWVGRRTGEKNRGEKNRGHSILQAAFFFFFFGGLEFCIRMHWSAASRGTGKEMQNGANG